MTAVEMQYEFTSKLQGLEDKPPFFDTYRIQFLLNQAHNLFIDKYRPLVDQNEIARKKLQPLMDTDSITPAANTVDNISSDAVFAVLPSDFRDVLFEKAVISGSDVKVKPIKYDEYNINKDNPFKQPDTNLVWRLDYSSNKHELIPVTGSTITSYFIRYIKDFTEIDIDTNNTSDLNANDHSEVVDIAISIVKEMFNLK